MTNPASFLQLLLFLISASLLEAYGQFPDFGGPPRTLQETFEHQRKVDEFDRFRMNQRQEADTQPWDARDSFRKGVDVANRARQGHQYTPQEREDIFGPRLKPPSYDPDTFRWGEKTFSERFNQGHSPTQTESPPRVNSRIYDPPVDPYRHDNSPRTNPSRDDCDIKKLSPECGSDSECTKYAYTGNRYSCPGEATLWTRSSAWGDWNKFTEVNSLTCSKGKLHANNKPLPDGTQVRCSTHTTAENNTDIAMYIIIAVFAGMLIIVIILIILCVWCEKRKWNRFDNNGAVQRKSKVGGTSVSQNTVRQTPETGETASSKTTNREQELEEQIECQ